MRVSLGVVFLAMLWSLGWVDCPLAGQEIVVSADGGARFRTIQAALDSIPQTNTERRVIFVRRGLYREKLRVNAPFVTLRGENRIDTRIEFSQQEDDFRKHPDSFGRAVINVNGDDFILSNFMVVNTARRADARAVTLAEEADRLVVADCDLISEAPGTLALGSRQGGRSYLARCAVRGAAGLGAVRGWCYATDCVFYQTGSATTLWHDGHLNRDMKLVLHHCSFDGRRPWTLAAHQYDSQYYFLNCSFASSLRDEPPGRGLPEENTRNKITSGTPNLWGARAGFFQCHREEGDFSWHKDNLSSLAALPEPDQMRACWTFGNTWNPERRKGPRVERILRQKGGFALVFSEPVSVLGAPKLVLEDGSLAGYCGHGDACTLLFAAAGDNPSSPRRLVATSGNIIQATEASACMRPANPVLPAAGVAEAK